MATLTFSPKARQDLLGIAAFIAQDNPKRAVSFVDELREACRFRARYPHSGRQDHDVRPGILWFSHAGYVFYYRALPEDAGIRVLRVFHGAQDHHRAFRDELALKHFGS
jgi:toxin ParE1/3/4